MYSSSELETTYAIVVDQANLVARHARNEDVRLVARNKDEFTGSGSFRRVHFERDSQGRISGLCVSNDRMIGLLFQRQP